MARRARGSLGGERTLAVTLGTLTGTVMILVADRCPSPWDEVIKIAAPAVTMLVGWSAAELEARARYWFLRQDLERLLKECDRRLNEPGLDQERREYYIRVRDDAHQRFVEEAGRMFYRRASRLALPSDDEARD